MGTSVLLAIMVVGFTFPLSAGQPQVTINELLDWTAAQFHERLGSGKSSHGCITYRLKPDLTLRACEEEDDEQGRMWLVIVADRPLDGPPGTLVRFGKVVSGGRGIVVGSTVDDVLRAYGEAPHEIAVDERRGPFIGWRQRLGVEYQYSCFEGQRTPLSIFIREGRVSAIATWISESGCDIVDATISRAVAAAGC